MMLRFAYFSTMVLVHAVVEMLICKAEEVEELSDKLVTAINRPLARFTIPTLF